MQCSYCGTPLPTGAPFCPNCGRPTTPTFPGLNNALQQDESGTINEGASYMDFGPPQAAATKAPDVVPPSSPVQSYQPPLPQQPLPNQQPHMIFGAGSQQVYPQAETSPQQQPYPSYLHYPHYPHSPQQPPTAFGSGQGYAQAGPPPQQPAMFVPGQSQQSGTFGQQREIFPQGYVAQPGSPLQHQQRRPGLSTGVIILLVVLVIAIIGGGGILLYATVLLPASQHTQTNARPVTSANKPTVQATAPITTTSPQDLYTQVMSRTPTLNDPLTAQDANSWQDLATLKACTFTGGELHLHGSAGTCIGESTNFSDFAYQVKMTIISGNIGGITFRFDAINRKFYYFAINPDGLYAVVYAGGGTSSANNEKLLASATSSAITAGLNQPNTLTVIARGSTINIYINTQFITTLTDSSSTIGAIGMLGGNSGGSTSDVAFSNVQVWTL